MFQKWLRPWCARTRQSQAELCSQLQRKAGGPSKVIWGISGGGHVPITHGRGGGDASYPSSAYLGSWGNAGNAETSAKQLGIAPHCTSVSPAAINFKIKKLNLNILKKKSQRHGWYHFVDQRYFIGWLVPTILPLRLMLLTSVEV